MKTITYICLFLNLVLTNLFGKEPSLFDGYLALVEVVSVEKLDPSEAKGHVIKTDLVHNSVGKVLEVYDGPGDIVGSSFLLTPPPYIAGDPNTLTHADLGFDGVVRAKDLPVGSKAVLTLYYRKDFDPMKLHYNPYRFPDRSVFFKLHASGPAFDKAWPELFQRRLGWARALKRFNTIEDDKESITYLKQAIRSENPLLAVAAVHLLKRFHAQEADDYFDEIVLAPGVSVYARFAMDHEFCLSLGQAWVNGKQKELEQILEKEASDVPEGNGLLSFRRQMIDNGSWFGGRGERE